MTRTLPVATRMVRYDKDDSSALLYFTHFWEQKMKVMNVRNLILNERKLPNKHSGV
jgi:hypothetical protein